MVNVAKALKRLFKVHKLLSQLVGRLQAIEEALDELQESRFVIGAALAQERACAVDALADDIVELAPYSTPEEVHEAADRVDGLQQALLDSYDAVDASRERREVAAIETYTGKSAEHYDTVGASREVPIAGADVGQEELADPAPASPSPLDSVE